MLLLLAAGSISYVTDGRVYCKEVRDFSEDCELIVSAGDDAWPIAIFLTTVQQHSKIASTSVFVPFGCTSQEHPSGIDVKYTFEATEHDNTLKIAEADRYAVYSYNCSGPAPTDWSFRVRHGWGWLDEDVYPLTFIPTCECILYLVLFVPCLVNRLRHKAMGLAIHTLILIVLGIHFVGAAISAGIYMASNFQGMDQHALIVPEICAAINNFCILCLSLTFAGGLSISREMLSPGMIIPIVVDCAAFAVINAILMSSWFKDTKSELSVMIPLLAVYVVTYIIFLIMNLRFFKTSYRILRVHLAMVKQRGIDPEGTPTRRKMRMLRRLREVGLIAFLVFVISTFFAVWDLLPVWIAYLIVMVANFVLHCVMCYLCRIRKKMAAIYGDEADAYVVRKSSDERHLVEWQPEMVLPPLPKAAYRSSRVHDAPPTDEEPPPSPDAKDSTDL